jgi:hypothetical protein
VLLHGHACAGFMQWKLLLVLLLGCTSGPLKKYTQLFSAFLQAVTAQLQFGLRWQQQNPSQTQAAAAAAAGAGHDANHDASQQQQANSGGGGFGLAAVGGLIDEQTVFSRRLSQASLKCCRRLAVRHQQHCWQR